VKETGVQDWIIEPKADATWPVVGAASIGAKLTRDSAITALGNVGSGYPSDPVTRAILSDLIRSGAPLPPWVRARWGTIEALRQQSLFS
jgi:ribonuclease HII